MTFRRPAAHLRRAPSWRKSGDESSWESWISEGEVLPQVSHPPRAPRPQSAIEGGNLDGWLEHLQRMQSGFLIAPVHNPVPAFNDRTTSMPVLGKETTGRAWIPSFSKGSSSCGSQSLCESSLGSQESLQTGFFSRPERRGSWERAHIMQAPKKEQAHLSSIAPVKIGWLPIQRRVVVTDSRNQNQLWDPSASQVKLKQPITPTFQKNRGAAIHPNDGELERSHSSGPDTRGVKTWQTPDQGSQIFKQVPEKQSSPANEGDRPVGWTALRRGWNTNRGSAFPGGSHSTETSLDPSGKSRLMKTSSIEHLKHTPLHQITVADFCKPPTLLQATSSTDTYKSYTPLHRTSSVQPLKATAPLCRTNSSSSVTTIVPQSKASFSSITISSRKVCRSSSLPGSDTCENSRLSRESSSPSRSDKSMDPNSRQVTVQRKATIVKVTEQRMVSGPVTNTNNAKTPPDSQALDTVVRRRKATIIKVTEHRESYTPAKAVASNPEYRHSYTEGSYKGNSILNQGKHSELNAAPSHSHQDSTKGPNSKVSPNPSTLEQEEHNGALHRSTLSLFVSNPLALASPAPSEVSPRAVGHRSDRPQRPQSCYGNVFGHSAPSNNDVTQPVARKWSFGLPLETEINPTKSDSGGFVSPRTAAAKEPGQLEADTFKPNGSEKDERLPPENASRRASPCLTLIKAPDPDSNQSPEEVLALNAAAIIANIKLQRQLSKKKTPNGNSEKDSTASPQGNTVTDKGTCMKPHLDQSPVQDHEQPHAGSAPTSPEPEKSPETISLQEALQRSRPGFISRSQDRIQKLERRAQERKEQAVSRGPQSDAAPRQRRVRISRTISHNDNLLKPRDKAIAGKEMQLRSKRTPAEVKKKKEEEKKREVLLTNKQRVELFKKKLLDQILHRNTR
ncbi:(E2-independent) E3 ubiquitin-conjugating enzyme FATS [Notolabrus celidotus]|uniref:(E2-independent) E3 ubiquitin-conjugating enzyme FATS n=1 Tax=Notolabrus celidotus TaxID=1203425 RepID=UPI00148FDCB3|nr:(E2-independent) E3 ubiquitin-conjugating enzyme FATS [Notolabrus celidotus]